MRYVFFRRRRRRRRESLLCLPFYYDVHAKHIYIKEEKKRNTSNGCNDGD